MRITSGTYQNRLPWPCYNTSKIIESFRTLILFITLLLFFSMLTGCEEWREDLNKPSYENPIEVAFIGDISFIRTQSENILFGAKLAFEEINAAGGIQINGQQHNLKPVFYDSKGDPQRGNEIAEEIAKKDISFIVGPLFSSVLLGMKDNVINNNTLLISYSATSPAITQINDNDLIWRTCPSDISSGREMAHFASEKLALKKAAILYRDDDFGQQLSQVIKTEFESLGGTITKSLSYPTNGLINNGYSLKETFTALLYDRPDIIFTVTLSAEIASIAANLISTPLYSEIERKPWLFVTDGVQAEEIIANSPPEMAEFVYGVSSANIENPNYINFQQAYIQRFGFEPGSFTGNAYDAVYLLAYAMQAAQSTETTTVKQYIREVANAQENSEMINIAEFNKAQNALLLNKNINYEGASGSLEFDSFGDPDANIFFWTIDNGEVIRIEKEK